MVDADFAQRAKGAVWGPIVADAAALGTHWIYDLGELARRFPTIEGFEAPQEGHYHALRTPGQSTHYGDAARVLLTSVAMKGSLCAADFGERFLKCFRVYDGYLDKTAKGTLANIAAGKPLERAGADDDQVGTLTRLAPVVARHAGEKDLFARIEAATRVTQDHDTAVAYAKGLAAILERLVLGDKLQDAVEAARHHAEVSPAVRASIAAAEAAIAESPIAATARFGQACGVESCFRAGLQAALHHRGSFQDAVLATIRAGGDGAGRAAIVGAILGAALGLEGIPKAWREKLEGNGAVRRWADEILRRRRLAHAAPEPVAAGA